MLDRLKERIGQAAVAFVRQLRWDRSPENCAAALKLLPCASQVYHAKYANNEIYLLTALPFAPPPREWGCLYPGPGDLTFAPIGSHHAGNLVNNALSGAVPTMHQEFGMLDFAFFYERGNNLLGPAGPSQSSIIATGTSFDELDVMASACRDVWFAGAKGETMTVALED